MSTSLPVWSWHIWVTNYDPDEYDGSGWELSKSYSVTGGKVQSYDDPDDATSPVWKTDGVLNGKVMMDRNLGQSSSSTGNNLYYQFGRKDPFPTTGLGTIPTAGGPVTIATSVNNPTTFYTYGGNWTSDASGTDYLWNDPKVTPITSSAKSIYDPCPDGWRLPLIDTWSDFSTSSFTWQDSPAGRTYNSDVFYTVAGYRYYDSGGLFNVETNGFYWSAMPYNSTIGQHLRFYNEDVLPVDYNYRAFGYPVRCVQDQE
ncbi:MAG: hypothetical protein LBL97_08730 [Prevotellaceae bacterium]|nr:hypothetical protein [Prevotellaceae bacterium]